MVILDKATRKQREALIIEEYDGIDPVCEACHSSAGRRYVREETDGTRVWPGEFQVDGPESQVRTGELRYHPTSGIELRITGKSQRRFGAADDRQFDVILGVLEGARHVTLIKCFDGEGRRYISGFEDRRIVVNYALVGVALPDLSKALFSKLSWKSPALTAWYVPGDVKIDLTGRKRLHINMKYTQRPAIKANIDGDRRITIWSGPAWSMGLHKNGRWDFQVVAGVSLDYRKMRAWQDVYADARALDLFFCIALGQLVGPPEAILQIRHRINRRDHQEDTKDAKRPEHVTFLNSQSWYRAAKIGHITDRTFTLSDMRGNVEEVFKRWIELQPRIVRILSLYTSAVEHESQIDTRLLLLAQGVEALHREVIGGTLLPDSKFDEVQQALRNNLPAQLHREARNVLLKRIEVMNEPGLARRIKELCRQLPEGGKVIFPHFAEDARLVAECRNNLVHVLGGRGAINDVAHRIEYLGEFLRNLLELSLLRLIGIRTDAIRQIAERNRRYYLLARHRKEALG